jgi:hypothetical protein
MNKGTNFLGYDSWECPKCSARWFDKLEHRHSHLPADCRLIRLYVRLTRDAVLCWPTHVYQRSATTVGRSIDSQRLVLVSGEPHPTLTKRLNDFQLQALANLALRNPRATSNAKEIRFYDADLWALKNRHKLLHRIRV